jgi:hypothetical protein
MKPEAVFASEDLHSGVVGAEAQAMQILIVRMKI